MDQRFWRDAMGRFATGVTVITTVGEKSEPLGMTANAFTSLSLDPPMVLICVDKKSETLKGLLATKRFCVHLLAEDQESVSRVFSKKGGSEKFDHLSWSMSEWGVPVLEGSLAHVECQVSQVVEGGDHLVCFGEGLSLEVSESKHRPLLFYQGKYQSLPLEVPSEGTISAKTDRQEAVS